MATTKRLFIAAGLPPEITARLSNLQEELKPFARTAKWVKPGGIHLTLKFLGYTDPARIDEISHALRTVVNEFSPMQISIQGCGTFPNQRRPAVLWAGVQAPDLTPLAQKVDDAMGNLGFEKETRPFSPHLTLARFREPRGLFPLMKEMEKRHDVALGEFMVSEITLYESILKREGAEYGAIQGFQLGSP